MEPKERLLQLLNLHLEINAVYHKFPREYYPGEFLHMREVHSIMEIGPAYPEAPAENGTSPVIS